MDWPLSRLSLSTILDHAPFREGPYLCVTSMGITNVPKLEKRDDFRLVLDEVHTYSVRLLAPAGQSVICFMAIPIFGHVFKNLNKLNYSQVQFLEMPLVVL